MTGQVDRHEFKQTALDLLPKVRETLDNLDNTTEAFCAFLATIVNFESGNDIVDVFHRGIVIAYFEVQATYAEENDQQLLTGKELIDAVLERVESSVNKAVEMADAMEAMFASLVTGEDAELKA